MPNRALIILALSILCPFAAVAQNTENVQPTTIASNNSNADEIYNLIQQKMTELGSTPECHEVSVPLDGVDRSKQECTVHAQVDSLNIKKNYLFWGSSTMVDVQGETKCWQKWLGSPSPRGGEFDASLWYFCQFNEIIEPQTNQ